MYELKKTCLIVQGLWLECSNIIADNGYNTLEDILEKIDFETVLGAHFAMGYLRNHCELNSKGEELVNKSQIMLIEFLENEEDDWEFDESSYLNV